MNLRIEETYTWLYLYDGNRLIARRLPTDTTRAAFEEIVRRVNAYPSLVEALIVCEALVERDEPLDAIMDAARDALKGAQ